MSPARPEPLPRTASSLTDERLEVILGEVPCLAGALGWERVSGGLTNVNVRVRLPAGDAIARVATDDSALLAIDRDAEHANSQAAFAAGAAPEVVCRSAAAGVLVVTWITGRTFSAADVRTDSNLPRLAAACRVLHAGPRFVSDFDMFEVQRRYLEIVTGRGFRLPPGYLDLGPQFAAMRRALAVRAGPTVPCHNDLLAENIVDDGNRLWLIDFEYSGNNDPCFELGNLAAESSLTPGQLAELVRCYYGEPSPVKVARARLFALASNYGWPLWASIQSSSSTMDFDFWAWGTEKYERALAEFGGADFDRLLGEVAARG